MTARFAAFLKRAFSAPAVEWERSYEACLKDNRNPLDAKFSVEKATGVLLTRTSGLVFEGESRRPPVTYALRLAYTGPDHYLFRVDATGDPKWIKGEPFALEARHVFDRWLESLPVVSGPVRQDPADYELHLKQVQEREAEADRHKEDPTPIHAIQREIICQMRAGKTFSSFHKEGGTNIAFDGQRYVKANFGEDESREFYGKDEDILKCIRTFYDWESRRDSFPHRPPELEVWNYIYGRLMR